MAGALRSRGLMSVRHGLSRLCKPNNFGSCRSISLFRHTEFHGKLKVPTEDANGNPIPRSPNGKVTEFELWRDGAIKSPEGRRAYRWSRISHFDWYSRWVISVIVSIWGTYYMFTYWEHILFSDSLYRAEVKRKLKEADDAAEAAAAVSQ